MRRSTLKPRPDVTSVYAHRGPTPYEIKFGEGATHYRLFPVGQWLHPDGTLKCWIKADDGLRYYR